MRSKRSEEAQQTDQRPQTSDDEDSNDGRVSADCATASARWSTRWARLWIMRHNVPSPEAPSDMISDAADATHSASESADC